jgi:ATP-dependent RNA helicase SUPV3L1/SUV3
VTEAPPVTALLGPTNTGKTHRAVERMLEHETGMIGLPLRLLAREVYDRVSARLGAAHVALVTGEERRIPARPRYWVCTVEAMPGERRVDFLAVDEIQLAAHRERGHVFTDRLLNARGRVETWFLGADTLRPLLTKLVSGVAVRRHPRLSRLSFSGPSTLGQLPRRSAVVAFSMARVYEIAEALRRRRGGAAVVLGALSPRARNAQVEMFQSGEVDHMVATDAIGMGLNLDLSHVAFADLEKFDGRRLRRLDPAELAQIAGRAGRHANDGTFGTLAPLPPLPPPVVRAIETHRFPPERTLVWRSSDLDFTSLDALVASLERSPPGPGLERVARADDWRALLSLRRDPEVVARASDPERVRTLWDACQIPDYRQLMPEAHARIVREVFLSLVEGGRLSSERLRRHVERLDDAAGDIETLLARMAAIRTWTYVSNHDDWVEDAPHWQAQTREIEDRLSDALHARLIERFVERGRPQKRAPSSVDGVWARALSADGSGALAALLARAAPVSAADAARALAEELTQAPHERFALDELGRISADGRLVGALRRGVDVLRPEAVVTLDSELPAGVRAELGRRLLAYGRDVVSELFAPLRSERAATLSPVARGLVHQLEQDLGTSLCTETSLQLGALTPEDRGVLRELGVVFGRRAVYLTHALRPEARRARAALWNVRADETVRVPSEETFPVRRPSALRRAALLAVGYVVVGERASRVEAADRPRRRRRRRRREPGRSPASGG